MQMAIRLFRLVLATSSVGLLAAAGSGCSSNDAPSGSGAGTDGGAEMGGSDAAGGADGGGAGCAYDQAGDPTMPAVSFSTSVEPIFQQSCAIGGASCHGNPAVASMGRPFLGPADGGATAIVTGLVGHPSTEDPQMALVTAGDPSSSFLFHKVVGDQSTLATECAKGGSPYPNCGLSMPYQAGCLDPAAIDAIRRWIAQGAKND